MFGKWDKTLLKVIVVLCAGALLISGSGCESAKLVVVRGEEIEWVPLEEGETFTAPEKGCYMNDATFLWLYEAARYRLLSDENTTTEESTDREKNQAQQEQR